MMKDRKMPKKIKGIRFALLCFRGYWQIGLLLVILGSLGDFTALASPLKVSLHQLEVLPWLQIYFLQSFFLREKIGCRDVAATFAIVLGVVAVAVSGDKKEKEYTLTCLLDLYQTLRFQIYVGGILALSLILYIITKRLTKMRASAKN